MSCCGAAGVIDDVAEPCSAEVDLNLVEQQILAASEPVKDEMLRTEFIVPGMHCVGCIGTLERGLTTLPQVKAARANLSNRTLNVVWDPQIGPASQLATKIDQLGFDHLLREDPGDQIEAVADTGRRLLRCLAVAGFAAANIMLLSVSVWSGADAETARLFHLLSGLIAVPAVAFAGRPFFVSAQKALLAGRLNMDVPISLAVLMALGMSVFESITGGEEAYFDAAVTLLFFLLIGRYLDHLMRERARGAVARLSKLTSKTVTLVDEDGQVRYGEVASVVPGMRLRVRPGERLPVNGRIISGSTDVDRSLVTGESTRIFCETGDRLEAGVLNLTGSIDLEATSSAKNSFLAEMAELMNAAENGRGRYVGIADRMARIYAPAVHLMALVTFIGWMVVTGGDWHASIYTAIAVLIITCPCALGLAVPAVHVVGAQQLMRHGILIRDGSAFERLAEADIAVFDKTGTLTTGNPAVCSVSGDIAGLESAVKGVALRSNHPAARAVGSYLEQFNEASIAHARELPGLGIEAEIGGKQARFGKPSWVSQISDRQDAGADLEGVAFGAEDGPLVLFGLTDQIREGARASIEALKDRGLEIEILSGDHENAVRRIAEQLSIDNYAHGVSPADKIERIGALQDSGKKVLMVGDGLNDAPALARAQVSMAPGSGCDIGRHTADFVFTNPSLGSVAHAYKIARKTGTLIRQNFAIALIYNSVAVPLAVVGLVTPLIAAIAMSTSSLVVIANAMRLNLAAGPGQEFGAGQTDNTGHQPNNAGLQTGESVST